MFFVLHGVRGCRLRESLGSLEGSLLNHLETGDEGVVSLIREREEG